jgi:hypothetical protein
MSSVESQLEEVINTQRSPTLVLTLNLLMASIPMGDQSAEVMTAKTISKLEDHLQISQSSSLNHMHMETCIMTIKQQ